MNLEKTEIFDTSTIAKTGKTQVLPGLSKQEKENDQGLALKKPFINHSLALPNLITLMLTWEFVLQVALQLTMYIGWLQMKDPGQEKEEDHNPDMCVSTYEPQMSYSRGQCASRKDRGRGRDRGRGQTTSPIHLDGLTRYEIC